MDERLKRRIAGRSTSSAIAFPFAHKRLSRRTRHFTSHSVLDSGLTVLCLRPEDTCKRGSCLHKHHLFVRPTATACSPGPRKAERKSKQRPWTGKEIRLRIRKSMIDSLLERPLFPSCMACPSSRRPLVSECGANSGSGHKTKTKHASRGRKLDHRTRRKGQTWSTRTALVTSACCP